LRSEKGNNVTAIGCRSRISVARFYVAFLSRNSLECDSLPLDLAAALIRSSEASPSP
jgi:hypothetical protein